MTPTVRAFLLLFFLSLFTVRADAATVRGSVSAGNGPPLSDAVVAAYDATGVLRGSTTTDAAGQYLLTVPADAYRLLAYDPTGTYATVFHGDAESFETTMLVQVADGSPVDAHFALPAGGTVSGSVSGLNAPVAGAVVEAYNLSGTRRGFATTDAAGGYSLVLPAGDYKFFAYDVNAFFAGEFAGNVRAFADAVTTHVNAPGSADVTFGLERAARASGTVVDAATRAPLGGQFVYAYTAAGALVASTTTDATGAFRFSLGPAPYRFVSGDPSRIYAPAFYAGSRSFERSDVVTLAAGEERPNLTLAAERGAIITGFVEAEARLDVAAYNLDGTLHALTRTDAAGRYELVVAPGDYKVAALDPTGAYATQFLGAATTFAAAEKMTLLGGQTVAGVDFHPFRAGRFAGRVRDAITLQTLGGMTVAAYDATDALVGQTKSAPDGTYLLAITPGPYRLIAFDAALDYAAAYAGNASSYEASTPLLAIVGGTGIVDFAMTRGVRVTGVVRRENGDGIDAVEVFALDAAGNRVAGATSMSGAFTIVVVPGTYRFTTRDPLHRFSPRSLGPITVGSTSPAPLTFTLTSAVRRRAART